jgi:outer membrane protein assembly factor BamB
MNYDRVFEPVVADRTLFIGFNDSDKITAITIDYGREKWSYYVDGPVRFPPVVWNDMVYFVSDDGYLFCITASRGELVWKFRGGPGNRKIIGNMRLISTWPARGGAVIEDGTVYFAASIWPFMGMFIYALDARTGKVIWMNDGEGARYMLQPHNAPSFAGVAPQGALVVAGDRLLVPGGRSVPACFDRHTGEFLYYELALNDKTGGSFVCASDDVFFNHHREQITVMYDLRTGTPVTPPFGRYPVLDGKRCYFSGKSVAAYDLGWIKNSLGTWKEQKLGTGKIPEMGSEEMKRNLLWELPVDASGDLIKAGNRLYAAGGNSITAINLPGPAGKPSIAWTKAVDGEVERLVAANGMLFAVTLDGRIMAFGGRKTKPRVILNRPTVSGSAPSMTREALSLIRETGVKDGYALFYGIGDGNFLEALAVNSNLHIIAVDPDDVTVDRMRRRFDDAGLYGRRLSVLRGDPYTLNAPPYMASLTVVYNLDAEKYPLDKRLIERLYYSMRPYGGKAWFGSVGMKQEDFSRMVERSGLYGLQCTGIPRLNRGTASRIISREGPLQGSADWTHNYGDIANTAKSDDSLVKLPLGILWFGGSSNLDVLPRHGHGPTEQVIGGRLFIEGINCLSARDVYTGRVIWKAALNDLGTYGVYYDKSYRETPTDTRYNQEHIPGANIRGTNFVATLDRVYVIQGSNCHVLDAVTGKEKDVFSTPPVDTGAGKQASLPWGYIGVYEGLLIGGSGFVTFSDLLQKKKSEYSPFEDLDSSASKKLFVMNRSTGNIIWQAESRYGFLHNGTAAGSGMIYCLDRYPPYIENQLRRRGKTAPGDYRLIAMDIKTGNIIWQDTGHVFGSFLSYSKECDILLQSTRPSRDMVRDENGERMAAFRGRDGSLLWDKKVEYPTFPILHGDRIITEGAVFNLLTGEPVKRRNPLTGNEGAWSWTRQYGCNYPIASEYLVTFRSGAAGFYDVANDGGTGNFGGFKSGCTATLVAADGVLNAPDYTRTCSCSYQNQTSLALIHMPENELWTYNTIDMDAGPVKNVGLNFGAPGDRLSESGTLWLDYPNVGGPSPDLTVSTEPEKPEWFINHSSFVDGGALPWVTASGVRGLRRVSITLAKESSGVRPYIVRLYFAEPEPLKPGDRVFTVTIQGKRVLENFDIVREAGSSRKGVVKEYGNIQVGSDLVLTFDPGGQSKNAEPIINGIEVVADGW